MEKDPVVEVIKEIEELRLSMVQVTSANESLAYSLKREIQRGQKLEKTIAELGIELTATRRDLAYWKRQDTAADGRSEALRDKVKILKDMVKILFAEKNVILRKLNLEPVELPKGLQDE